MSEQKEKFLQRLAEISAELSQENNSSPAVSLDHDFSLKKPFLSDRTIEELLEEGYIGVDYDLVADTAFAAAAHKFKDKIKWTRTRADENGDVALMTPNLAEFDRLLEFMLDEFGWCPQVYSNEESPDIFIFEPQNELEEAAIAATIEGDYGWKESLYSLDYYNTTEEGNLVCFIFATLPKEEQEQEWLLVEFDRQKNNRGWSVHPGTLEQVCYIWAEQISIPEPNYKPTADEILDALESPSVPAETANIAASSKSHEDLDANKSPFVPVETANIAASSNYDETLDDSESPSVPAKTANIQVSSKSDRPLVTADELRKFGIYFDTTENLHDLVKERFLKNNSEGIEEYDFEGLSTQEVIDFCMDSLDWYKLWDESIFDLLFLFYIKLLHDRVGIPYSVIIKKIIPLSVSFEYYAKYMYDDGISLLNNSLTYDIDSPRELIEFQPDAKKLPYQDFIVSKKTLISVLLDDVISGFVEDFNSDELIEILENNSDRIKQKGFSKDELIECLEDGDTKHIFDEYFDRLDKLEEYYPLIESCYPGYQGGNNFLGSLISKVQFKYIMDAILLEEIPEKYTAEYCEDEAFLCTVCDRSGWYEFELCDLDEEDEYYNFNPQYSTTILITLPTKNEDEEIYISGLYHWELKLLCLDLPAGQSLVINSPDREPCDAKDFLEMERYLQEMKSENNPD